MPKFVARKPEKEVISMRIDTDVLADIDQKAAAVGISRNELLNQMICYALSNMDEPEAPEHSWSMMFYDNLWKVMKEKGISQYALIRDYHISPGQLTRLKRNESVSTHTIEVFCRILQCSVGEIMEYVPEDEEKKH